MSRTHSQPALIARHLCRGFGAGEATVQVLRDVSLELDHGQVVLLMGPSGSGKSTLLAVLSGLLRPDSGGVSVLGEDLWRLSERARERFRLRHFGFVFQGFNLFPSLTASEQLEMVVSRDSRASASARASACSSVGCRGEGVTESGSERPSRCTCRSALMREGRPEKTRCPLNPPGVSSRTTGGSPEPREHLCRRMTDSGPGAKSRIGLYPSVL
jgi:ABC-type dipeptide/oligopeptide/nickel transport system ATPase component